jgi:hypothetical protein
MRELSQLLAISTLIDAYNMELAVVDGTSAACKPFLFLSLPAEIRNKIYRLCLTNVVRVNTSPYRTYDSHNEPTVEVCIALLRVNRQLHDEASTLLYTLNRFQAHPSFLTDVPYLLTSSKSLHSTRYCRLIRRYHICVRLDCDPFWTTEKLVAAFNELEELVVEAWQAAYGTCGYAALRGFAEIRGVKKARVEGAVTREFAEWLEMTMQSPMGSFVPKWKEEAWNVWQEGNR